MSDFTPQVETREIADSDLDSISGGIAGINISSTLSPVVNTLNGVAPVTNLLNDVTAALPTTGSLGL